MEQFRKKQVRLKLLILTADTAPFEDREAELLRLAESAFSQTGNWVVFHRAMMATDGIAHRLFADPADWQKFIASDSHAELQEMIAAMRSTDTSKGDAVEPERMITIRIPMTLHKILNDEANDANLSINQLCVSKLIQPLLDRHIPEPKGKRRGRKPGPQGTRPKS